MPVIFAYTDYRKFLADYYEDQKTRHPAFSYQSLSNKAGFSNKGFIFNVIKGVKNLSRSSMVRLCQAMGLGKTEADYFENLVALNQADNFTERNFYYEKLNSIRINHPAGAAAQRLRQDQYEYYSRWYNITIRSLIDLYPFKGDYKWLAKMVNPSITAKQAKKSVELLERLRLIEKGKDGYYKAADKIVTTGREVQSLAIQQFHVENMKLAERALKALPKEQRNISGLTLGISKEAYDKICDIIYKCQDSILKVAEADKKSDRVYQLNFHFFPVSKSD